MAALTSEGKTISLNLFKLIFLTLPKYPVVFVIPMR